MYHHEVVGWNSRLDEIQAAILLVKMKRLAGWSFARGERACRYEKLFNESGLVERGLVRLPPVRPGSRHIYHQYTIRAERRDPLREHLTAAGVSTGVYYPVPLHLQECFRPLGYARGDFPHAERAAAEVVSLPIFPELTEADQDRVVREIAGFYGL
jgi:dTDP-4-amino-4,6-dideoxygalactose transaminase